MTGDYILSIASILIARLKNDDVTLVLSEVSPSQLFIFILCGLWASRISAIICRVFVCGKHFDAYYYWYHASQQQ